MKHLLLPLTLLTLSPLLFNSPTAHAAPKCRGDEILNAPECKADTISDEEERLYHLINAYRAEYGLPPIPFSPSLAIVASRHVQDLAHNLEYYDDRGRNWRHGWSVCPYDADRGESYSCMWDAPQWLGTPYPGRGFENLVGGPNSRMTADYALERWQRSSGHNAVILNQGMWVDHDWQALGIAIYRGYAAIWFGEEPDPAAQ